MYMTVFKYHETHSHFRISQNFMKLNYLYNIKTRKFMYEKKRKKAVKGSRRQQHKCRIASLRSEVLNIQNSKRIKTAKTVLRDCFVIQYVETEIYHAFCLYYYHGFCAFCFFKIKCATVIPVLQSI